MCMFNVRPEPLIGVRVSFLFALPGGVDCRGRPAAIRKICVPKPLLTLKGTPNTSAFGGPEMC
jgi:hypothetical protein